LADLDSILSLTNFFLLLKRTKKKNLSQLSMASNTTVDPAGDSKELEEEILE